MGMSKQKQKGFSGWRITMKQTATDILCSRTLALLKNALSVHSIKNSRSNSVSFFRQNWQVSLKSSALISSLFLSLITPTFNVHAEDSCPSILRMFGLLSGSTESSCEAFIAKFFALKSFSGGLFPEFLPESTAELRIAFLSNNGSAKGDVSNQIDQIIDQFGGVE
jgi:hypothetical protein